MNTTNPRDTDRDILAQEWYASLPAKDKRRVDEWTQRAYMMLRVNPQCKFSHRMALEVAFMFVVYSVYGPMDARIK